MSSSLTTKASTDIVCECDEWMRPACGALPFYKKHGGKRYCVLHYPGEDKSSAFDDALKRKLDAEDFDFSGVWFSDNVDFGEFTFTAPAEFGSATFRAKANFGYATFSSEARFDSATFEEEADFSSVAFEVGARFSSATFKALANFSSARFGARAEFASAKFEHSLFLFTVFVATAEFIGAKFGENALFNAARFDAEASFFHAEFSAYTSFAAANFKDYCRFEGDESDRVFRSGSTLSLQSTRFEQPGRVSFHTLMLRPHWFVNADARWFQFINAHWHWREISVRQELKSIISTSANRLLAIACRNLAVNAEENRRYEEASKFRYMAMEARRLERWRGFAFWRLDWWYWLASGYGERVPRALVVFLAIWLGFALLYWRPEPRCPIGISGRADCIGWDTKIVPAGFFDSFFNSSVYAIETMTLQKPEPRPLSPLARLAVLLCTVLGPVQAALLALAIRRKFMR